MKGHAWDGGTSETTRSNGESGGVCLEVVHGAGQIFRRISSLGKDICKKRYPKTRARIAKELQVVFVSFLTCRWPRQRLPMNEWRSHTKKY